jgi:hypothetical protein
MTEEEARKLLRTLNETEDSYPLGWDGEGFQIGIEWEFNYEGSGKWKISHWTQDGHWEYFDD